jgi:hypothetical protein
MLKGVQAKRDLMSRLMPPRLAPLLYVEGTPMASIRASQLLLSIAVGVFLALGAWRLARYKNHKGSATLQWHGDALLLGLLVFAAFALGVLITYMLLVL